MVDFVDSFGSGVCMPLQILFSILAYWVAVVLDGEQQQVGGYGSEKIER